MISGCGGLFKSQKHGEITSPNYPHHYPLSTHCDWFISVATGNSIKITIDDLQIEDSENCEYDALEVRARYLNPYSMIRLNSTNIIKSCTFHSLISYIMSK